MCRKRLVLLTDSMGRARPDIQGDEAYVYEETYPYLLKCKLQDLYDTEIICMDSIDTIDAKFWSKRIVAYKSPDVVLYHIGINDCAKRIFTKNTRAIIFRSWFPVVFRRAILHLISKKRRFFIKYIFKNKVYASKVVFERNIVQMIASVEDFGASKVYGVGISQKPEWYDYRSPGINDNIEAYNKILEGCFGDYYVDADSLLGLDPSKDLISDGIHFTKETHQRFAVVLENILRQCVV